MTATAATNARDIDTLTTQLTEANAECERLQGVAARCEELEAELAVARAERDTARAVGGVR